jgi:hypothetical protein
LYEVIEVPTRDFPASFDAFVAGFEAQEVEDKTSDGDEVVCSVIFSDSTAVFVKGDVEDPVAAIFDSPMLSRAAKLVRGIAVVTGDVVVVFVRGFFTNRSLTIDADDLAKISPFMAVYPWSAHRTGPSGAHFVSSMSILFITGGKGGVLNSFPPTLIGIRKEINQITQQGNCITPRVTRELQF